MLRGDADPELRAFDPLIRVLHWLTLFLVGTIFMLAFSIRYASSKEAAAALIQLHRPFGVDDVGSDARSPGLAPILALSQLAL